jgi:glycerol kinase
LIDAAVKETGRPMPALRVDGGMTRNDWFLQCQADTLGLPVLRSPFAESTALGAAFLAGMGRKLWKDEAELCAHVGEPRRFVPTDVERVRRLERWRRAVAAVIGFDRSAGAKVG